MIPKDCILSTNNKQGWLQCTLQHTHGYMKATQDTRTRRPEVAVNSRSAFSRPGLSFLQDPPGAVGSFSAPGDQVNRPSWSGTERSVLFFLLCLWIQGDLRHWSYCCKSPAGQKEFVLHPYEVLRFAHASDVTWRSDCYWVHPIPCLLSSPDDRLRSDTNYHLDCDEEQQYSSDCTGNSQHEISLLKRKASQHEVSLLLTYILHLYMKAQTDMLNIKFNWLGYYGCSLLSVYRCHLSVII